MHLDIGTKIKASIIKDLVTERDKYFSKGETTNENPDKLVQAAAVSSGFVSENFHHRRDKEPQKHTEADKAHQQVTREFLLL
jgi:hypothetical protein